MNYLFLFAGLLFITSVFYFLYQKSKPLPQYPVITENLPLIIFYTDLEGRIIYLNKLAEETTGWLRDEARGKHLSDLFSFLSISRSEAENPFEIIKARKEAIFIDDFLIFINRKQKNYRINISGAPVCNENDKMIGAIIAFRDIADELEYHRSLSTNEEKYRTLFESSRDAIYILDPQIGFVDCNRATLKNFGYADKKSLLPKKPSELSPLYQPDGSLSEKLANEYINLALEKGSYLFEWIHMRKDGKEFPALVLLNRANYGGKTLIQGTIRDISKLKNAEKELLKEKEFTETALNAQEDTFFLFEIQTGKAIRWNKAFEAVSGYTFEEIENLKAPESYYSPEDLARASSFMERILESGSGKIELELICKDKSKVPFEYNVSVIPGENDEPRYLISIGRDMTERNKSEIKLQASEKRYRVLFERSADAILIIEGNKFTDCNEATVKMLRYDNKKELLETHPSELSPEFQPDGQASYTKADEMMATALKRGSHRFEWDHKRADGEVFPVEVLLTSVPWLGEDILHVVWRDITERKKTEKELDKFKNYLANIIDSMPSVLIGVDPEGLITLWNNTAETRTGISEEDALGRELQRIMPQLSRDMENIRESMRTGEIKNDLMKTYTREDEVLFENVVIYPLKSFNNIGAVIRIDDITEKVRLEEMMVQSEKMLSVGGLAAGMAHEINNPLAGMLQTAGVMARRLGGELDMAANREAAQKAGTDMETIRKFMEYRDIKSMLSNINESGKRVASIVENMLSFARKGEGRKASQSIIELVNKTLELALTDYDLKKQYDFRQIRITKEFEEDIPDLKCEGGKIQQVILNILRNGAQAMIDGKTETPEFTIRLSAVKKRKRIRIELEDNGPGMDESVRKRIFEPFFTTKPIGEGTGLGLSVSFFIITENHNGTLTVDSKPGIGTNFIIELPVA